MPNISSLTSCPTRNRKIKEGHFGGTMRLGAVQNDTEKGTIAEGAYGKRKVEERHRHRYEVNPDYIKRPEKGRSRFSGTSPDGKLMEIAELPREASFLPRHAVFIRNSRRVPSNRTHSSLNSSKRRSKGSRKRNSCHKKSPLACKRAYSLPLCSGDPGATFSVFYGRCFFWSPVYM